MTFRRIRFLRHGASACAILAFAACSASGPIPTEVPDARPPDGLLTDSVLQRVVDQQVRRDGASLVQDLSSPRADVRARAAFALGSVQDTSAVPALVHALADTSAAVRRDAAFALGQTGDTMAFAPLTAAYRVEKDPEVRHRLMEAMGKIPALAAPSTILNLDVPRDGEADRALALSRLAAIHGLITENVLVWLLDHLRDPNPAVRMNAAYFVGRVHTSAPWADRDSLVRKALSSYRKNDPAAMFLLQGMGRHADLRDATLTEEWAKTATDWRIRANAMASLGPWDPHDAVTDLLMNGLDDPSVLVAVNAAIALARRPLRQKELAQVEEWIDAHPQRLQVIAPLLNVAATDGEKAFVFKWLDAVSPNDETRLNMGLQALARLYGDSAFARLQKAAASTSPTMAADGAVALVQRWSQGDLDRDQASTFFRIFSAALRQGSPRVTSTVAAVFADSAFVHRGSVDTLMAAYRRMSSPADLEPMIDVLSALGQAGDLGAVPFLRGVLTSPQPALRRAAAMGLTRLTGQTVTVPPDLEGGPAPSDTANSVIPDPWRIDWAYLATLGDAPRLVLDTNRGTVVVRLDTDEAPQTVQTVARLAQAGKYDGVPFHRVVPNFVAQGGDFTDHNGFGSPGFTIDSEFTEIPFLRGVIGMASAGKDTEGSQFFITYSMQPHLDGAYTSFGWVVKGMGVVDQLVQGDTLLHASIERGG
ncbi:MAG: peptidylprolyl isomerase [Gemmatimonadetes bacterium]|nr:peptidylprolyl isomerase [Gemmatimonadota bacterium]